MFVQFKFPHYFPQTGETIYPKSRENFVSLDQDGMTEMTDISANE